MEQEARKISHEVESTKNEAQRIAETRAKTSAAMFVKTAIKMPMMMRKTASIIRSVFSFLKKFIKEIIPPISLLWERGLAILHPFVLSVKKVKTKRCGGIVFHGDIESIGGEIWGRRITAEKQVGGD